MIPCPDMGVGNLVHKRHAAAGKAAMNVHSETIRRTGACLREGIDNMGPFAHKPKGEIKITQKRTFRQSGRPPMMQANQAWLAEFAGVELLANELPRRRITIAIGNNEGRLVLPRPVRIGSQ